MRKLNIEVHVTPEELRCIASYLEGDGNQRVNVNWYHSVVSFVCAPDQRSWTHAVEIDGDQFLKDGLSVIAGAVSTPEDGYAKDGGCAQFMADVKSLRKIYDDEKQRRVYYQNIVYSACNLLDRIFTPPLVCGTKDEPSTQLQMRLGALVDSFDPDGIYGDSDERVTTEWLVEQGWDRGVHWPNVYTQAGELLEWRGAGLWIGKTPIALAETRGKLRRVAVALGVRVSC